jgi:hypothetical protein
LGEGVADAAEFARVAQAVLEAAEDARDVADLAEQFAQFGEARRLGESSPTRAWRRLISGRSRVGAASQRSSRRAPAAVCGAVDGAEQRAVAGAAAGGEDLEIAEGRRVEEEGARAAVFLEAAEVLGLGAEIFRGVVDERTGGPRAGGVGEAEALRG